MGAIARVAETRAGGEARGGGDTGHGENVRARVDVNGRARVAASRCERRDDRSIGDDVDNRIAEKIARARGRDVGDGE